MGLLDAPIDRLGALVQEWTEDGSLVRLGEPQPWPRGSSLVLQGDLAVELGNPAVGSRAVLLWADGPGDLLRGVSRIGPDLGSQSETSAPLGRVVVVDGHFEDDYEAYMALQAAVSGVELRGISVRSRPSSGQIWMRVSAPAASDGLTLAHPGAAIVEELEAIEGVRAAAVLWICGDPAALKRLQPVADAAARIVGALIKRRSEEVMDCGSCEYNDICDEGTAR